MSNNANSVPFFTPGERVKILRERDHLTRKELGLKTGMTYHQIEAIERGIQNITPDIWMKFIEVWPHHRSWLVFESYEIRMPEEEAEKLRQHVRELLADDDAKKN